MNFAILAAPALAAYLSPMLEDIGQAAGVRLSLYNYGQLSGLRALYPQIRDQYDGFLLSGLAVQTAIRRYFPEDQKPSAVFDTELEEVYLALLSLLEQNRGLDLSKVVVDIYLQVNERHNCLSLIHVPDMEAARQSAMDFWKNISAEELDSLKERLFSAIKKRWEAGEIVHVISRNSAVEPMLASCGIPHTFLYPSKIQLIRASQALLRQISVSGGADYMAAVVAVSREPSKEISDLAGEEDLCLHQAVLEYKKESTLDFQIQNAANGLFLFTNLKTISRMTGNFRRCALSDFLQSRLSFRTYVGYGSAPELSSAKKSALEALRESVYRKAAFAVLDGSLVGPLIPEADPLTLAPPDEELMKTARNAMLAPQTIRRLRAILEHSGTDEFTAADLAEKLNIKIRHTNHILENLTAAGYAVQAGQKSTGTKGRPTRIYRLLL